MGSTYPWSFDAMPSNKDGIPVVAWMTQDSTWTKFRAGYRRVSRHTALRLLYGLLSGTYSSGYRHADKTRVIRLSEIRQR